MHQIGEKYQYPIKTVCPLCSSMGVCTYKSYSKCCARPSSISTTMELAKCKCPAWELLNQNGWGSGPAACSHAHCMPHSLWDKILKFTPLEGQRHWGPEKVGNSPRVKRLINGQHHPGSSSPHSYPLCSRAFPDELMFGSMLCALSPKWTVWCIPPTGLSSSFGFSTSVTKLPVGTGCLGTITGTTIDKLLGEHLPDIFEGYRKIFRFKCTLNTSPHWQKLQCPPGTDTMTMTTKHKRSVFWQLKCSCHVAGPDTHFTKHCTFTMAYRFWNDTTLDQFLLLFQFLHYFKIFT